MPAYNLAVTRYDTDAVAYNTYVKARVTAKKVSPIVAFFSPPSLPAIVTRPS